MVARGRVLLALLQGHCNFVVNDDAATAWKYGGVCREGTAEFGDVCGVAGFPWIDRVEACKLIFSGHAKTLPAGEGPAKECAREASKECQNVLGPLPIKQTNKVSAAKVASKRIPSHDTRVCVLGERNGVGCRVGDCWGWGCRGDSQEARR